MFIYAPQNNQLNQNKCRKIENQGSGLESVRHSRNNNHNRRYVTEMPCYVTMAHKIRKTSARQCVSKRNKSHVATGHIESFVSETRIKSLKIVSRVVLFWSAPQ